MGTILLIQYLCINKIIEIGKRFPCVGALATLRNRSICIRGYEHHAIALKEGDGRRRVGTLRCLSVRECQVFSPDATQQNNAWRIARDAEASHTSSEYSTGSFILQNTIIFPFVSRSLLAKCEHAAITEFNPSIFYQTPQLYWCRLHSSALWK